MRYSVRREARRFAPVSVGVPTYNGSERVSWLLQTYARTKGPTDVSLVLLDDGSARPGETDALERLAEQYDASLLVHHKNEGITPSWNDLVNFTSSGFCVLLNDDLFLTDKWLDNLIYFLDNNECGGAAPNILFCAKVDVPDLVAGRPVVPRDPHTKFHRPELAQQHPDEIPGCVMCALGCGFGFRREIFDKLGGFDERTKQIYNESWFGTKAARDLKLPSFQIPAPRVWHLWSATFAENPELHSKMSRDRAEYEREFGGNFDVTHPKFMHGTMPPRVVKWIGPDGQPRERELTIQ